MIGGTLSIQNLEPIRDAMAKIKPIDRSAYFGQYFAEVCQRIAELKAAEQMAAELKPADQDNELEDAELEVTALLQSHNIVELRFATL